MRNLAAASPVVEYRVPVPIQEDRSSVPPSPEERIGRSRRPTVTRKTTAEPSVPEEESVAFPSTTNDPVIAYSRRSILGQPARTMSTASYFPLYRADSTFSLPGSAAAAEGQGRGQENTVAFPSTAEYVRPARHRTASMFTVGGGGSAAEITQGDVRRLLRTLSTVSIYESGEGLAGGLADVAPIGRYIVQGDRTGDDAPSEMPKDILGDSTESPSDTRESGGGEGGKRRFRV